MCRERPDPRGGCRRRAVEGPPMTSPSLNEPGAPEPLSAEEEARLRRVLERPDIGESGRIETQYVRRLLATLDAARSEVALDPERLARALHNSQFHGRFHGDLDDTDRRMARDLAAEYAALASSEPAPETEGDIGWTNEALAAPR